MMRRLFSRNSYIVLGILCCMFLWLQLGMESYAFTRTTGEVTGSSVKVRKEASTQAEMVASVRAGDDLEVTDAVNGDDGKVWYKILINANEYGYIRSDFVKLATGAQAPSDTTQTTTTPSEPATDTTEITQIDPQRGHTSTNNVKVRKQATTNSDEVDRLNQDQIFNISGTAKGSDGKVWYYVSYVDGGASKKGFIRSDLVTIMEEEPEEEPEKTPDEPIKVEDDDTDKPNIPAPTKEYEAVYTTDENGNYIWYLYDRTLGQRHKIEVLITAGQDKQKELDELAEANFGLKLGLVIVICLIIMLGVAFAFYIYKMREEQEESGYKKKTVVQGTGRTQNVTRPQNGVKTQSGTRSQTTVRNQSNVRPQTLAKPQITSEQKTGISNTVIDRKVVDTQAKNNKLSWKAKNFLEDNDELEFGFLDFDEDDE